VPSSEPASCDRLEGVGRVRRLGRQQRGRRPAGAEELQLAAVLHPAGDLDHLAIGVPERDLVVAGFATRRRCTISFGPGDFSVPHWRHQSTPWRRMNGTAAIDSTLLTVVGQPYRPVGRRERRAQPRLAAAALERVEQRGLLAADVGAGAAVQVRSKRLPEPITSAPR
jgi:hypothetical protein